MKQDGSLGEIATKWFGNDITIIKENDLKQDVDIISLNNRLKVFEQWFKKGDNGIYTEENFYSTKEISAGGTSTEEGESSGLGFDDLQWYLDQNKYVKEEDIAQLIPDNITTKDDVDKRISENCEEEAHDPASDE